jgi:hypothetical protein
MTDVISRDILEWARDLAVVRDLIAGERGPERAMNRLSSLTHSLGAVVTPLRPLTRETAV